MKKFIREMMPPGWLRWWRRRFGWQWFRGDHATWAEARRVSTGYADKAVLARVLAATREVQVGRAMWERDGVTFQAPQLNAPLLTVLKKIATTEGGRLELVDVGGALGSTWWQHRAALATLAEVRWRVVEQPHYVAAGEEFADQVLSFHGSLDVARRTGRPAAALFSSMLPYVEDPCEWLTEAVRLGFPHIIIDRTSFAVDGRERLAVQHTPPELGGGNYPCWIFSRVKLLAPLAHHYALRSEWSGFDDVAPTVSYRGFHFERLAPGRAAG